MRNHHFFCTPGPKDTIQRRCTQLGGRWGSYLRLPHNLAPGTDPRNEDEFLTLGLLIVRVCDTDIGKGASIWVQFFL